MPSQGFLGGREVIARVRSGAITPNWPLMLGSSERAATGKLDSNFRGPLIKDTGRIQTLPLTCRSICPAVRDMLASYIPSNTHATS